MYLHYMWITCVAHVVATQQIQWEEQNFYECFPTISLYQIVDAPKNVDPIFRKTCAV
jgi:hypothetical protein